MAIGDGAVWNEALPDNSVVANQIDEYDRDLRIGVRSRMSLEHVWPASQTGTAEAGYHRYITLQALTGAPSLVAASGQVGAIYATSAGGNVLSYEDSAGNVSVLMPSGVIVPFGGTTSPVGWYMCTGGAFSRTGTDAALFAVVGTIYGTGDGSSTFNVPDLRGRIPVCYKAGDADFGAVATSGGEATHVLTVAEMPSHVHAADAQNNYGSGSYAAFSCAGTVSGSKDVNATGGDGAHNNLQPYIVVNYIIKR